MRIREKRTKLWLIASASLFAAIILLAVWILLVQFEGEKPSIVVELPSPSIGVSQEFSVSVSDDKSGVRRVWVGLLKDGEETVLLEKDFPATGLAHKESFEIKIEPRRMGITDGKGILRVVAWDFSWRKWQNGNRAYVEKEITIDTRPPVVNVLTRVHNIRQGGAALVVYRVSEPHLKKSGVYVGENFFPGHSGYFEDANILMTFFALNYKQGPETRIFVKATDHAGNSARASFSHYIGKRTFRNVTINVSDRFLDRKMPEFDVSAQPDSKEPMLDKFLIVNRDIRQASNEKIAELGAVTDNVLHWEGVFLRLPGSVNTGCFGDHREYRHKGRAIDHQVHLGIDLASTAHAPVPASNNGRVVFAGCIGIYGKTVMIDHGFGLFSAYSHLSSFNVHEGQSVSKNEIIGRTGSSGLAGGDHLHFSILIHNTFVNPLEWWDATWIKNNISGKLDAARYREELLRPL